MKTGSVQGNVSNYNINVLKLFSSVALSTVIVYLVKFNIDRGNFI